MNFLFRSNDNFSSTDDETSEKEQHQTIRRGRGRPRKPVDENEIKTPKRGRGRPKKPVDESEADKPKRGRGRPKKEENKMEVSKEESRKRGRPSNISRVVESLKVGNNILLVVPSGENKQLFGALQSKVILSSTFCKGFF